MSTDVHPNETTAQISPDLWAEYEGAMAKLASWHKYTGLLREKIMEEIGDAHAGMVGNRKVATYRPVDTYRIKALVAEYPELAQHFEREVTRTEFDVSAFDAQHHDILEKFRSRAFRVVTG